MITTEKILLNYDSEEKNILPALKEISAAFGYLSRKDAGKAAEYFSVPVSKVYEAATFYDMLNVEKQPLMVIQICYSTHCVVNGSNKVVDAIEKYLHIKSGDENNPRVKLERISCIGRCGEGPVVVINGRVYERVNESSVIGILGEWV